LVYIGQGLGQGLVQLGHGLVMAWSWLALGVEGKKTLLWNLPLGPNS